MINYYDIRKTLARGSPINMIIGQRGCGKTYSTTRYVLDNFLQKGEKFLYIRRNRNQIAPAAKNFFADYTDQYPITAQHKMFLLDDKEIGYYCNLSEAQTLKSGFDLKTVTTIVYDEVIEKNPQKYLIGEYIEFSDLLDTTLRLRNDAVVIFLGNSYSIYNPYTLQWGTSFAPGQKRWASSDNFYRVELIEMPDISKVRETTIVGRFTKGTEYDEMATHNQFIQDTDEQIKQKTGKCQIGWSVEHAGTEFYLWQEWDSGLVVIDTNGSACKWRFTVDKDHAGKTYRLIKAFPAWILKFRELFGQGRIFFQTKKVRAQFLEVMKYL